jgi:hypothetical protein
MFFKKKDDGKLPDLPPLSVEDPRMNVKKLISRPMLPGLDDLSHITRVSGAESSAESEKHSLPTFPDSPMQKGFSQAAIKDAIIEKEDAGAGLPELPDEKEWDAKTKEEWPCEPEEPEEVLDERNEVSETRGYVPEKRIKVVESNESYRSVVRELPVREPEVKEVREVFRPAKKNEDIFVRIDKFRSARKSLNDAKMGMQEIDNLLKKIRETKMREEQELTAWEQEMTAIKTRLKDVTENIFEKAE